MPSDAQETSGGPHAIKRPTPPRTFSEVDGKLVNGTLRVLDKVITSLCLTCGIDKAKLANDLEDNIRTDVREELMKEKSRAKGRAKYGSSHCAISYIKATEAYLRDSNEDATWRSDALERCQRALAFINKVASKTRIAFSGHIHKAAVEARKLLLEAI